VYPPTDVSAYWAARELPPSVLQRSPVLAPGLYCRDLALRGTSYADAVIYWWSEGSPDRMDADHNGIPCETVYSPMAVAAFW
jgi:hypothetical protein